MAGLAIIADYREKASGVPEHLESLGVKVSYGNLSVGDYVISESHVVERKTARDLVSSLYSGRLFDQALRLMEAYGEPIFIVEGDLEEALASVENPRVLWGTLASLSLKFGGKFHLFYTFNPQQTAELIYVLAKQVSERPKHAGPVVKHRRKLESLEEAQLTVVCSLPGVGPRLAERLLKTFKTVRRIFQAQARELTVVEGLSQRKAEAITRLLDTPYGLKGKAYRQHRLDEGE